MAHKERLTITPQHEALLDAAWNSLKKWRPFIIGIDGRTHSGKSSTARFMAWQLGMSAIETDLFLDRALSGFNYLEQELRNQIHARLKLERPVIVEGVFLLELLERVGLSPDFLVYAVNLNNPGEESLEAKFKAYEDQFAPQSRANFVFSWSEEIPI